MKIKIVFIGIAIFLCALAYTSMVRAEALPPIIISEIQITGGAGHTTDDFVELYNSGSETTNISSYRLRYKNSNGTENSLNKIGNNVCIAPHGYYLWANKDGIFANSADTKTGTNLSSDYSLALLVPESVGDTIIDSVSWGGKSHPFDQTAFHFTNNPSANESMLRDIVTGNWLLDFSLTPTPTKSVDTTCPVPPPPPDPIPDVTPPTTSSTIRLNEIFPNPLAKGDAGEFVELYNFGTEPTNISGWILRDATKTGKYIFPADTILAVATYFVVTDQSFKLSLNNSNETIALFDDKDKLIDSIHYEKTKENVSLNYTATGWRGGTPTPGALNQINNLPEIKRKVPKKGYRDVPIEFQAKGQDTDGDTLKYVWDFGDGHKSYKADTSHTYAEKGTYTVTLKTDDGREEILETFTIEIRSYVYPKIRITSLIPNPSGKDTDSEWIMLENREKKSINLKGFGIATGWKSLANHPIREDFIIKPKQEAKLTRAHSLFTLPNQKGKVELRAPDGKVLQKIKYKLEKSIAEDTIYRKKKGERWNFEMPDVESASEDENVSEEENESAIPIPEQISEENPAPASDIPAPDELQNDQDAEKKVLGVSTTESEELSRDHWKRNQQWIKLINFGTRAAFPENIEFSPENESVFTEQALENSDASLMRKTLLKLNASLNNMLNNSSE